MSVGWLVLLPPEAVSDQPSGVITGQTRHSWPGAVIGPHTGHVIADLDPGVWRASGEPGNHRLCATVTAFE